MFLYILFWILFALAVIGQFTPLPAGIAKVNSALLLILIGILGYWARGNPLTK